MDELSPPSARETMMPRITVTPRKKKTLFKSRPTRFKSQPIDTGARSSLTQQKLIPNNFYQDK